MRRGVILGISSREMTVLATPSKNVDRALGASARNYRRRMPPQGSPALPANGVV